MKNFEELGSLDSAGDSDELTESLSGDSDEFSLEDLGEEYSSLEEIDETSAEPVPVIEAAASDSGDTSDNTEFSIFREKLDRVTETLNHLPRNLKLIIEDLIGNKGLAGRRLDILLINWQTAHRLRKLLLLQKK